MFPDGDLDFESLNFNGNFEEDETGAADENRALHQEGTGETAVLFSTDPEDMYASQSVDKVQFEDKKDFQGVKCTPEEDNTSSDGDCEPEGSVSGEDEDEDEKVVPLTRGKKLDLMFLQRSFNTNSCIEDVYIHMKSGLVLKVRL